MSRLVIASLLSLGVFVAAAPAQGNKVEKKTEKKKDTPKVDPPVKMFVPTVIPGEVEINFLNGSTVRMIVQSDKLEVATAYGKLLVPVKDVRAIEFGLHFPDDMEARIEQGIKNLGSSDYREREKATKSLVELGPFSYPAVLEASRGKDVEVSPRAKDILKKLMANHPKKDLKTSADDRVVTPNFTIAGRILTPTIKAKTEYFGEVDLPVTKMRALRAMTSAPMEMEVTIDASKYANANQWMETDFTADGRSHLVITASGIVDGWPQQPGNGAAGPNGLRAMQMGNNVLQVANRKITNVVPQQHSGMLIGRIGTSGEIFIIGERYEGNPESEGKLYLHIGPSQFNQQSAGQFDVKITRKSS